MADTKLPKRPGKGNSSEFLSKSSSMGRGSGENVCQNSGESHPMNMINFPIEAADEKEMPFDVALATYRAAYAAQINATNGRVPEDEYNALVDVQTEASKRLILTPATTAEQLTVKRQVFFEDNAHEYGDVEELVDAIFDDAERLAESGQVVMHGLPTAKSTTMQAWKACLADYHETVRLHELAVDAFCKAEKRCFEVEAGNGEREHIASELGLKDLDKASLAALDRRIAAHDKLGSFPINSSQMLLEKLEFLISSELEERLDNYADDLLRDVRFLAASSVQSPVVSPAPVDHPFEALCALDLASTALQACRTFLYDIPHALSDPAGAPINNALNMIQVIDEKMAAARAHLEAAENDALALKTPVPILSPEMAEAAAKWQSTVVEYTTASAMGRDEQIDEDELNRLLNIAYEASTAVAAVPCRNPEDLLLKVYMLALIECGLVGPGQLVMDPETETGEYEESHLWRGIIRDLPNISPTVAELTRCIRPEDATNA